MTVAEIKDFIEQEISFREEELEHHKIKIDTKDHINSLEHILSMLDELEPKEAHYIELKRFDETEPFEYRCSSCRRTFYFEDVDKYCCKCGAKMTNAKEILEV